MSFKKVAWGTAMISSVRLLRLASQFVAIPILARLLTPAEYGLVAIAMPFALFAMMLADAGIGMSLVRTPATERVVWSTCFWLSTLLGAALALFIIALSPIAADIFNEPQLAPMLMVLSFTVFAQAVHLIPVTALQQAQRFKAIAVVEIFSTALGLGTALYMAYHGYGAWAIIGQQVAIFAVKMLCICSISPFRPLVTFKWHEIREHLMFGRNVVGTSLTNYFSRSADNWIVGKALGATMVGFYSMAFLFARLPQQIVSGPLQFVMYSQLARMKDNTAGIGSIFLLITRLLCILIIPAMGMVAAAQEPVFRLLLSDKWMDAGYIYLLLAPACAVQAVLGISETVAFALNRSDIQLRSAVEYSLLWVITLVVVVSHGIVPAAIAFTVLTLLYQLRYLALMLPLIALSKRRYCSAYTIPLLATGIAIAGYLLLRPMLPSNDWLLSGVAAMFALAAIAISGFIQRKGLMEGIRGWSDQNASEPLPKAIGDIVG